MIEVKNLKKSYSAITALDGVNLSIHAGEFYGLLGPNGAGKTTAISIMSTILNADSGQVLIGNYDTKTEPLKVKQLIGVVPQEIALYEELSAYENLLFWGSLYKIQHKEISRRANELLMLLGLLDRKDDKIKNYSGGMQRRINIAAALLHRPKVLFLDEPTVGIDPQSRNLIFEVADSLHRQGMTIIYTTHYMEEAERLCNRIGIIDNGKIIAEGNMEELKRTTSAKDAIAITFANHQEIAIKQMTDFWPEIKQLGATTLFLSKDVNSDLAEIVSKCQKSAWEIASIEIQKTNLETIFLNLTGKQLRD